jgi:hypothetical protein
MYWRIIKEADLLDTMEEEVTTMDMALTWSSPNFYS